jgi:hypothetical protein
MRSALAVLALTLACLGASARPAAAGAPEDLAAASASGRTVFVAVGDGAPGVATARSTAERARSLAPESVALGLDLRDPGHAAAAGRLGLARVEAPLVLLVARGGLVVAQERAADGAAERLAALVPAPTALASVATANGAGRPVFLVVADGTPPEAARATARQAQLAVPDAVVVELDRADPRQADAVARFRVAAAPVPMLLVVATNGVPTGAARPGPGAAERLASLVPSKAKAEYLRQLSEQRVAVVMFTRADMPERSPLFEAASAALRSPSAKIGLVPVDLADPGEQRFLDEWKVDRAMARPLTVLVNPKGMGLGRLEGAPTAEQILQTAAKKPCCADPTCDHNR